MEPVREESHEKDPNVPKILCQMENHLGWLFESNFYLFIGLL